MRLRSLSRVNLASVAATLLALAVGGAAGAHPDAQARGDSVAGAASALTAAHRGLESLPAAARAAVSTALGGESRAFAAQRSSGGYRLNGGGVTAHLDASAVKLSVGSTSLGMTVAGIGRGGRLHWKRVVSIHARGNRVSLERGGLTEWYAAGPLGIEQGFTLSRRPAGATGPVTLALRLTKGVRSRQDGSGTVFLTRPGKPGLSYGTLSALDASGRPLRATLQLLDGAIKLRVWDAGARYPLLIDPLIQQGSKLMGGGEDGTGGFGSSVALSADGNTALIGGPFDNTNVGAAWVFTRTGATWTQQGAKLMGTGESGAGSFGSSVALSANGNTALIGGYVDNSGVGAAWAFTRTGSSWTQQGPKLTGSGETGAGNFGSCVALSATGDTALIGAPGDSGGPGAAWAFTRTAGTWAQQGGILTGGGEVANGGLGLSVALSADGSTALIGGPGDNGGVGATWVFTRSAGTWAQQGAKLTGSGEAGTGGFGLGVALSADGSTAVIGGPTENGYAGAAWVFTRVGTTWTQQGAKLTGSGEIGTGGFGSDVAVTADGNTALIGGLGDNSGAGALWVFTRAGSVWTQQGAKLTGSDTTGTPGLGLSVALSADGSTALAGGPGDNGGVGAAWVFTVPAPAAPTAVAAVAANARASVSFTPPAGPVASYTVTASPGGATGTGASSPIVVRGLTNGTAYTFTVTAGNAGGSSPASAASSPVTPSAPGLYWTNRAGTTIGESNLDGTVASQSFIGGASTPSGIAVDGQHVYWTNDGAGTIGRANLDGTSASQSFIGGGADPVGLAVDGQHVYWANRSNGTIGRANLDGTSASQSFISGADNPSGVAVDGRHVYWTNYGSNTIGRADLDGGNPVQDFITGTVSPVGLTVDGLHVYWANAGSGTIGRANLDGTGADQSFIGGAGIPTGVAVDGQHLYWTNLGTNAIGRSNVDGGSPDQGFVTGAADPFGLAVLTVPGPPVGVSAVAGNTQATVSFTPGASGGAPVSSFTVTASPGGAHASGPSSPIVVTGLTNGAAYTFTVTATNAIGTSVASQPSAAVTPATVPGPPTGVSALPGSGAALVSFTPGANGGSAITSFTVTASPGGAHASGPSSPIFISGLNNGTAYTFTVTAMNAVGTGPPSQPSSPVTPVAVPDPPTGVSAAPGNGQATVSFTPGASGGSAITSFTATASPGGAHASGTTSPIVVPGLTNGTAYTFTVTATNAVGTGTPSQPSSPVTPATVPGAPTGVLVAAGDGEVTVSFSAPGSNGGAAITSYTVTASPGGVSVTTSGSPVFVFGLTNGTSYTFTVTATNTVGTGPPSAGSAAVTPSAGGRSALAAPPAEGPRPATPAPPQGGARPPEPAH